MSRRSVAQPNMSMAHLGPEMMNNGSRILNSRGHDKSRQGTFISRHHTEPGGIHDMMQHDATTLNNLNNMSVTESAGHQDLMDDFPTDVMAFNQGLATYASLETNNREQRIKEVRLMEALEKQTALLDTIANSYNRNRELRQKADLRKLKNKLEALENQKLFRELEIQQLQMANDAAQQNNQLIFNHLNAQAQLKANPIILNMSPTPSGPNPLLMAASFRGTGPMGQQSPFMSPQFKRPGMISPFQPSPGIFNGMPGSPMNNPSMFSPFRMGPPPPMGLKHYKLPPIKKSTSGKSSKKSTFSKSEDYNSDVDVDKFINRALDKKPSSKNF